MAINREEIEATLARARKTVAAAKALMTEADLRIQETDRFLAKQGFTREQVMAMKFTPEQRAQVNEELKRQGFEPLSDGPEAVDASVSSASAEESETVDRRQRRLGTFMQKFRI